MSCFSLVTLCDFAFLTSCYDSAPYVTFTVSEECVEIFPKEGSERKKKHTALPSGSLHKLRHPIILNVRSCIPVET